MRIEAKNLVKIYGDRCVVNDNSFYIDKGEVVCLLGPNGAGKTTLTKLICGLYHPTKGKILINGIDIETLKSELTNYGLGMSLSQIEEILGLEEDFFEQFNIKKDALIIQFNDKFRKNNTEE